MEDFDIIGYLTSFAGRRIVSWGVERGTNRVEGWVDCMPIIDQRAPAEPALIYFAVSIGTMGCMRAAQNAPFPAALHCIHLTNRACLELYQS